MSAPTPCLPKGSPSTLPLFKFRNNSYFEGLNCIFPFSACYETVTQYKTLSSFITSFPSCSILMLPGSCPVGIKAGIRQKQHRGLWFIAWGGFPQKACRILFGFAFYYHFWTAGKPCTLVILLTPLCLPGVTCGRYKTPWNHHRMALCFPSNLRGGCDAVKVQCRGISGGQRQASHCNTRKLQSREMGISKSEEVAWSSSWLQFSIYNPGNSLSMNIMSLRTFLGNLLWSTFQSHLWFWSSSLNSIYDLSSHTGMCGPGATLAQIS